MRLFPVLAALFLLFHAFSAQALIAGDVNNDSRVNVQDVQRIINGILGLGETTGADIDYSGRISVLDVQTVINRILGYVIDADNDGLCDAAEQRLGTDPFLADSDGDGVFDGDETASGSDPLDSLDPLPAPLITSFAINGGASTTTSRTVTLSFTTNVAATHYMIAETLSFSGAAWQPLSVSPTFQLSLSNGLKTVYLKVKNDVGESGFVSATIVLDSPPLPGAPVITAFTINGGETVTSTRDVTLSYSCADAPTHYLASESPTFAGATWLPYDPSPSFTLSEGEGLKTVYLKVKNANGVSPIVGDSILLSEGAAPTLTGFAINNGDPMTISRNVSLTYSYNGSPISEYMVSESSSFVGASWQFYAPSPVFILSQGNGPKTIYLKVKNNYGESNTLSSSIVLDETSTLFITAFTINNGATITTTRSVALTYACYGTPTHYLASESLNFMDATWQTYTPAPSFILSPGNGTKKVYLKTKNAAGESNVRSDTITLDEPAAPFVASFTINNGAPATTARSVALTYACYGTPTHYLASESLDFTGAAWQIYAPTPTFALSQDSGPKTVYLKTKNAAGESNVRSASIFLAEQISNYVFDRMWMDINTPIDVALDASGNMYVVEFEGHRVRKFGPDGTYLFAWGGYGYTPSQFAHPSAVTVDPTGNVFVADQGSRRIQKFTGDGGFLTSWVLSAPGKPTGSIGDIAGDAFGKIHVLCTSFQYVCAFTGGGTYLSHWGSSGSVDGKLYWPVSLAADTLGNILVADSYPPRIQQFSAAGLFITKWNSAENGPGKVFYCTRMEMDAQSNAYVIDGAANQVVKFDSEGAFVGRWGSLGAQAGQFEEPEGIAIDAGGNVYVADYGNNRVQKFRPQP